jgi:hypothetical protein
MYENQIDILKTPNKAKSVKSDAGDMFMRNFFANDKIICNIFWK